MIHSSQYLKDILANPILSEKTMLGFVKEKEQGELFGTQLLPERQVNTKAVNWKIIKNTRELAPEIREGAEELLTNLGYDEQTALVKEIREGAMLTEQSIQEANLRDLVRDHLDHLTERNILKQEAMIFNEIITKAGTVGGQNWDWSNTTTADPLNDILKAVRDMKKNGFVVPDTLIIDPDREYELMANKNIRDILLYSRPDNIIEGNNVKFLGRIKGMDVFVANAVYDSASGVAQILNKKTILMKRGSQTGNLLVREPLQVRRFADEGKRAIRLQVFKTMYPVIYRPMNIYVNNHV